MGDNQRSPRSLSWGRKWQTTSEYGESVSLHHQFIAQKTDDLCRKHHSRFYLQQKKWQELMIPQYIQIWCYIKKLADPVALCMITIQHNTTYTRINGIFNIMNIKLQLAVKSTLADKKGNFPHHFFPLLSILSHSPLPFQWAGMWIFKPLPLSAI